MWGKGIKNQRVLRNTYSTAKKKLQGTTNATKKGKGLVDNEPVEVCW